MTNDEQDNHKQDIPELHVRLTPRLSSPDPEAIRDEATRRSATKRKTLMAVGGAAVVSVLALAGVFAFNGNDVAETATIGPNDSAETEEIAADTSADTGAPRTSVLSPTTTGAPLTTTTAGAPTTAEPATADSEESDLIGVSSVIGLRRDAAAEDIVIAGFNHQVEFAATSDPDLEGRVIGQFPEPSERLAPGSTVRIVVGELDPRLSNTQAPADVLIPELAGVEFNEALNILFELDVRVSRVDEASVDVGNGIVIRTEPGPGTELEEGSIVTVVVSSGVERVVLPDVEGLLFTPAKQTLEAQTLEVRFVGVATSEPGNVGRVLTQDPPAGFEVERFTMVTLEVGGLSLFDPLLIGEGKDLPGAGAVWLDSDGTLYVENLSTMPEYWESDQFWFDEQASLTTATFDDNTTAIILALPSPDEDEDPPNVFQIFLVGDGRLDRVFVGQIGVFGVTPLSFAGDGTMSYVEDPQSACLSEGGIVPIEEIFYSLADGDLVESSRRDTGGEQDCSRVAG